MGKDVQIVQRCTLTYVRGLEFALESSAKGRESEMGGISEEHAASSW